MKLCTVEMGLRIVFLYSLCMSFVFCFNIDIHHPIVYVDPLSKSSDRSSYFGYSVILHNDFHLENAWIQIGAPRANNTAFKNNTEPGIIFRCNILGPCRVVNFDTTSQVSDGLQTVRNKKSNALIDKKDHAWIGGAMDIDERSGRSAVCGHRWINNQETAHVEYRMLGVCYWSHLNDTSYEKKLVPLSDSRKAKVPKKSNTAIDIFYYGQGQAGFSAHMTNLKNATELLLGAPGFYNWDGSALIYRDAMKGVEFSNLNVVNATATRSIKPFGLFGYSLTSGYFFKKNELLYVSGGPRSNDCIGLVLVYTFNKKSDKALIVKNRENILEGYQVGEYFGSALAAGDINQDGLDDLVVGAPFYTNSANYNEGRIFVYLGMDNDSFKIPNLKSDAEKINSIEGKAIHGQFGTSLMFLGDLQLDGYADIAVGAPYENDGSGVVYIFRGNSEGLDSQPCQRIVGKSFIPQIRGFGISMSKPTDIDNNSYDDLAIGAYASGHVVLLRSKPVITLNLSVSHLYHNGTAFQVIACFWYEGKKVPSINVTRSITVDELWHRAYLLNTTLSVKNITLVQETKQVCENISISIKSDIIYRNDPITVSVSQELVVEHVQNRTIHVGQNNQGQQDDNFCKDCPILNTKSVKEQTFNYSLALGCGDDNVCLSNLDLKSKFLNNGSGNEYVLGSKDYLQLEANISNSGEIAYLTELAVELPKSVYFLSLPTNCKEKNSSVINCTVANVLNENQWRKLTLDLDMKEVNNNKYVNTLNFTLTLSTASNNTNRNKFIETLRIVRKADIALTGKSSQQSYSYGNITYGKSNFTQTYQVEKFDASPIDEVLLIIQIPTQINGIQFLHLYTVKGSDTGQTINCQSNDVKYILEEHVNSTTELDPNISTHETTDYSLIKRSVRAAGLKPNKQEQKPLTNESKSEFEYPSNRTYYINCTNSDIVCSSVTCSIGPFKAKQNLAKLHIKMLFDVQSLSELLGTKDIIIFSTHGFATISSPSNFIQSGNKSDNATVSSVFIGESPEPKIDNWIIIAAATAGVLLLLLLIAALVLAGFFRRTKKMELKALREANEVDKFKRDSANCEVNKEDVTFEDISKQKSTISEDSN